MSEDNVEHQLELKRVIKAIVEKGPQALAEEEDDVFIFKELVMIAHLLVNTYEGSFLNWKDFLESPEAEETHLQHEGIIVDWLAKTEDEGKEDYLEFFRDLYSQMALVPPKEKGKIGEIVPRDELEDPFPEDMDWLKNNLPEWK